MTLFPSSQADVLACRGDLRRRALAAREALVPAAREALTQRVIGHLEILLATVSPRVLAPVAPSGSPPLRRAIDHVPGAPSPGLSLACATDFKNRHGWLHKSLRSRGTTVACAVDGASNV